VILLFLLKFSLRVHSQPVDFTENVALDSVIAVNNPLSFKIPLDYDQSFYGTVTKPSLAHQVPDCKFYPSAINNFYSTTTSSISAAWANAGGPNDFQVENSMNYYFYSRSSQFGLTSPGHTIDLNAALTALVGTSYASGIFMVLDPNNQIIYQLNKNYAFSYDVVLFDLDIVAQNPAPEISVNAFPAGFSFSNINTVKFYQGKIYIVTDSEVYIYQCSTAGILTLFGTYNAATFGASPVNLVDITFKGNYAFILDNIMGVFTIDTTSPAPPLPSWRIDRKRGKFIEVAGNSVLVISETTSLIYEYFLVDPFPEVVFNQYLKLYHGNLKIKHTASDINYLVMATQDSTLVIRHSIPARFYDSFMQVSFETVINPALVVKAVSATSDGTSEFLTIRKDPTTTTLNRITATKPHVWCLANGVPGCKYLFEIQGVQATCPTKLASATPNDPQTVCFKDQQIEIVVLNSAEACPDSLIAAPLGLQKTDNTVIEKRPGVLSQNKNSSIDYAENKHPKSQGSSLVDLTKSQHPEDSIENFQEKDEVKPRYEIPVRAPRNRTLNRTRESTNPFDNRARRANMSRDDFNQILVQRKSNENTETVSIQNTKADDGRRKAMEGISRERPSRNSELHNIVPGTEEVERKRAEVDNMAVMINENNKVMNGLVISVIVLFVIIALLGSFIALKWRKGNRNEEEIEEEEIEEIVATDNSENKNGERKRGQKYQKSVEMSTTFGDESKIKIDMDLSKN